MTVSKGPQTVLVVGLAATPEVEVVKVATSLPLPTKAPLLLSPLLSISAIPVRVTAWDRTPAAREWIQEAHACTFHFQQKGLHIRSSIAQFNIEGDAYTLWHLD